jgi:hypothetical protein
MLSDKAKNNLGIMALIVAKKTEYRTLKTAGDFIESQKALSELLKLYDALTLETILEELKEELPEWAKEAA